PWYVPGTLTIDVDDSLDLAGGRFTIASDGASAEVTPASESTPADLGLGIAELGSLYFGGVDLVILAMAGRINDTSPGAAVIASSMFSLCRAPYSPNGF